MSESNLFKESLSSHEVSVSSQNVLSYVPTNSVVPSVQTSALCVLQSDSPLTNVPTHHELTNVPQHELTNVSHHELTNVPPHELTTNHDLNNTTHHSLSSIHSSDVQHMDIELANVHRHAELRELGIYPYDIRSIHSQQRMDSLPLMNIRSDSSEMNNPHISQNIITPSKQSNNISLVTPQRNMLVLSNRQTCLPICSEQTQLDTMSFMKTIETTTTSQLLNVTSLNDKSHTVSDPYQSESSTTTTHSLHPPILEADVSTNDSLIPEECSFKTWHRLGKNLAELHSNNILCDVNLVGNDYNISKKVVPAHSVVLAASSKFFYDSIVKSKRNTSNSSKLQIMSLNTKSIEVIIDFIYGTDPTNTFDLQALKKANDAIDVPCAKDYLNSLSEEMMSLLKETTEPQLENSDEDMKHESINKAPAQNVKTENIKIRNKCLFSCPCCPQKVTSIKHFKLQCMLSLIGLK